MDQYFDAVVDKQSKPIFNGTPEETRAFLETFKAIDLNNVDVCLGRNLKIISAAEYLKGQPA